jgi:uncharacterized protein (DUF305 family)
MRRICTTVIVTLIVGMAASACGGSSSPSTRAATESPSGPAFNDNDVEFAQGMIGHHEQAIEMADMAFDPNVGASTAIKDFAMRIKTAQDQEIKQMTALLKGWNKPTAMDTSDGHDMASMPGMMSASAMKTLGAMTGTEFDKNWATMMIAHHEGALVQAKDVSSAGSSPDILALAAKIITTQQSEITELTALAR